jgi:hypothetical protein
MLHMAPHMLDATQGVPPAATANGDETKVTMPGLSRTDAAPRLSRMSPRAFRQRLSAVKRWGLLACPAPKPVALEKWARWRSDAELNVAAVLPDHSEAGRAAAAAALAARGGAVTGLQLSAPSYLTGKGQRLALGTFFGWAYRLRRLARFFVLAGVAVLLGAVAVLLSSEHVALRAGVEAGAIRAEEFADRHHRTAIFTRNADALLARMAEHPAAQRAAMARQGALAGGGLFLGGLGLWALMTQVRRRPARVLVMRPPAGPARGAMKRLIAQELRPFGHVVGLSEKPVQRVRVAWTGPGLAAAGGPLRASLLILGTPLRVIGRILDKARLVDALVASAQDYRSLARRLMDRAGQNFAAEMTTQEAILARPTDAWRDEVTTLLLQSSDVVVIDASALDEEDAAALSKGMAALVSGRIVFVSSAQDAQAAEAQLAAAGVSLSHPVALYARGGRLLEPRAFRETVLAAMRSRIGAA